MNRTILTFAVAAALLIAAPADARPKTFLPEDVERMKAFTVENATSGSPKDCLETLNEAMRILFDNRGLKLKSTVDLTMNALKKAGLARGPIVFGFKDEEGRNTSGVTAPETLRSSVWDGLLAEAEGVPGWHVFGYSPLDGNHSVTLALDLHDPADPKVYWADQWSTKGGWKLYGSKEELDGEIERLTSSWWKSKLSTLKIKFKSDSKLYPLIPQRSPVVPEEARLSRTPRLNLRSVPSSSGNEPVATINRSDNEVFKVVGRQGVWVQLERANGQKVWAHGHYLTISPVAPAVAAGARGSLERLGSTND